MVVVTQLPSTILFIHTPFPSAFRGAFLSKTTAKPHVLTKQVPPGRVGIMKGRKRGGWNRWTKLGWDKDWATKTSDKLVCFQLMGVGFNKHLSSPFLVTVAKCINLRTHAHLSWSKTWWQDNELHRDRWKNMDLGKSFWQFVPESCTLNFIFVWKLHNISFDSAKQMVRWCSEISAAQQRMAHLDKCQNILLDWGNTC